MKNYWTSILLITLLLPIFCRGDAVSGPREQSVRIRALLFEANGDYAAVKAALEAPSDKRSVMAFNAAFLPYFYLFFEEDLQKADAAFARLMALQRYTDSTAEELKEFYEVHRSVHTLAREEGANVADAMLSGIDQSDFKFIDMSLIFSTGFALRYEYNQQLKSSTGEVKTEGVAKAEGAVAPNPPAKQTEADPPTGGFAH